MNKAAVSLLWVIVAIGACSAPVRDVEQASSEVAEVTIGVKRALVAAPDVDAAAIRIRLDGEKVLLDGFVGSKEESDRAEALAREEVPDRQVINRIKIR